MPDRAWLPAHVGLGSNLDDPSGQVNAAIERLGGLPDTLLVAVSPLYRSAPLGRADQPFYVNAAAALITRLGAVDLLDLLIGIETGMGRVRGGERWGPRVIDLDLLVFADQELDQPGLRVPHPGISSRNFVLYPLRDLAPDLWVPGQGRVAKLAAACDRNGIERIS
jgi:2-amino-4-hydroxy-6-hydroxymethyldihydropteridine diphosphokinase